MARAESLVFALKLFVVRYLLNLTIRAGLNRLDDIAGYEFGRGGIVD